MMRSLLITAAVWVFVAAMFVVGIPLAVHLANGITPTGVADYGWTVPELLTGLLQGAPMPAATQAVAIALVIVFGATLVVFYRSAIAPRAAGRASILRLRFYVWRKSHPRRAPLTARAAEPLGRIGLIGFFGIRWFTDMLEETRVLIAPSGAGKTVRMVVQLIFRARGAIVTTSTKTDVLRLTGWVRKMRHPQSRVMAFDPEGMVPWMEQVKWDIVAGCDDSQMAMKRAAAIVSARPLNGSESTNSGFFTQAVTIVLQCMLHAAAVKGLSMREVMRWMGDFADDAPYDILRLEPGANRSWEAMLTKYCRGKADETVSSTDMSASGILNAFSIASILDAVCPRAGDSVIDITRHHLTTDTLYLICKGEDSPAASAFTALVESLYLCASDYATRTSPLNPPLELVLDEAMNVCPIPSLPRVMSTGRGEGISATVVAQDLPQVVDRYGKSRATTIINNATELVVMGGLKDASHLQDLAHLAGSLSGGRGRADQVLAPDKIRTLRDGRALLFYRNQLPAVITLPPWWKSRHRHLYQESLKWADKLQRDRELAA